jgi:glycosyltransferase involved in cell wall biosynthesis
MMITQQALVCAPRLPEHDRESGALRLYNLIELLRELGWSVTFVTPQTDGGERYERHLRQLGIATYVGSQAPLEALLRSGRFRLALAAFWGHAEPLLPLIRRLSPATHVLIDSVDLHFLRNARGVFRSAAEQCRHGSLDQAYASEMMRELNVYAAADGVLAVSQKEADLINDLTGDPRRAWVVSDFEEFAPSPLPFAGRQGIVFVGNFWHRPNVDAARYLCDEILPRLPREALTEHPVFLVGHKLHETVPDLGKGLSYVRAVGWAPSVLPYLYQARVSVIPLRYGAGTKRKLLQSLMAGTPTVSTSIGVEGLGLRDGEHVLVADDPASFAQAIARLLEDEALWRRLAAQGRDEIVATHGREVSQKQFLLALTAVLAREPARMDNPAPSPAKESALDYSLLVRRVDELADSVLPPGACVVVVSKGDEQLLRLGGRTGWHFPQRDDGSYAGFYPAGAGEAIIHLEALRVKGGDFFFLPATSSWWFDHYPEFKQHLESQYREVIEQEDVGRLFDLRQPARPATPAAHSNRADAGGSLPDTARADAAPAIIVAPRHRKKVLVLGIYLADQSNCIEHVVERLADTQRFRATQAWVALGGEPPSPRVAAVTVRVLRQPTPKYAILNDLLAAHDLSEYDYVVSADDDITIPACFLDQFLTLQGDLDFVIAQPARTGNSYLDHPIVEQQLGVVARQTQFVEIGPLVSFHRSVYDIVFPFDLTSPMGWGYEYVWAYRLAQLQWKMGIIDALPIEHNLRKPVANYNWDDADQCRAAYLAKHPHLSAEECFRVIDIIPFEEAESCQRP